MPEKRGDFGDPIGRVANRDFAIPYIYPIQRFVISNVLDGINQLVVLPTGAGKSLCFQLPLNFLPGLTLVIEPLIALMKDQLRRLKESGIQGAILSGDMSNEERNAALRGVMEKRIKILLTTPEMLTSLMRDHLFNTEVLAHLVIDEAHCISEWGDSFRPSYLRLSEFISRSSINTITAFTATASPATLERIKEVVFFNSDVSLVLDDPDRPNIFYKILPALSMARALTESVRTRAGCCIIFNMSRSGAEIHARLLRRRIHNREIYFYHAGLNRDERRKVEEWFLGSKDGILTATSAYGMGMDKADIRTVIHADLPPSLEAYLQESGRAGRDGLPSEAILIKSYGRDASVAPVMNQLRSNPLAAERFENLKGYLQNTRTCRREYLLTLLGQKQVACSGCDICSREVVTAPAGEREIEYFVGKNRRRFSSREVISTLHGRINNDVLRLKMNRFPGYGSLHSWEREDIEEALEVMIKSGRIDRPARGFRRGKLR